MLERKGIGPERDLLPGFCRRVVTLVAPDGDAGPGKLHADLVVAAGIKIDVEQGKIARLCHKAVGEGGRLCAGRMGRS